MAFVTIVKDSVVVQVAGQRDIYIDSLEFFRDVIRAMSNVQVSSSIHFPQKHTNNSETIKLAHSI